MSRQHIYTSLDIYFDNDSLSRIIESFIVVSCFISSSCLFVVVLRCRNMHFAGYCGYCLGCKYKYYVLFIGELYSGLSYNFKLHWKGGAFYEIFHHNSSGGCGRLKSTYTVSTVSLVTPPCRHIMETHFGGSLFCFSLDRSVSAVDNVNSVCGWSLFNSFRFEATIFCFYACQVNCLVHVSRLVCGTIKKRPCTI